ncbi:MAG: hypothetical protein ABSA86_14845 [Oryzomonas sp.]
MSAFFCPLQSAMLPGMDHHHHKEPISVFAGDTMTWHRNLPDYQPADGWALTYALRGPASLDITTTTDPDSPGFLVSAICSVAAGSYYLQGSVTKGAEIHTIYNGTLTVLPNISAIEGTYDGRSYAKQMLDAIDAYMLGNAPKNIQEMMIDGTKISRIPEDQLRKKRGFYAQKYWQEQNPGKLGPAIQVHFRDGY